MDLRPIGVFDSGIGGLTVVKELMKQLPKESIVYFGDTARVPYGNKSKETVVRFSLENVIFLLKQKVKLIIVACNTVSSLALPSIENHFTVPLVGVIKPGVKRAILGSKKRRIGVIGTHSTINSKAYEQEIRRLDHQVKVFSRSCPLFVPLVEEGMLKGKIVTGIIKEYLSPLKSNKIDSLILGCTHYPLLKPVIAKEMGKKIELIDSAQQVVQEIKDMLEATDQLSPRKSSKDLFFVSDESKAFFNTAKVFLGRPLGKLRRINNV